MTFRLLLFIITSISISANAAPFATGASEVNGEAALTIGSVQHRSPMDRGLLGIRHYGFGYGQSEFGRYATIRGKNNGGIILHGLEPQDPTGVSALLGLEPLSGEVSASSNPTGTRYIYQPAVSYGAEFRVDRAASLVLVGKNGYAAFNTNASREVYTPTYSFFHSQGAYLSWPGVVSLGYVQTKLQEDMRETTDLILFKTVHFTYEENRQEKIYSITLDLD